MASDALRARRRSPLFAFTLIAASLVASSALAQPSSADKETARTLMKEGDEKFAAKDYAGALKAYQAAHDVMKVPTTGLALAKAQIERGMLVEARDTLLEVTRHAKEAGEPAAFAKARDEAAALGPKIADRIPSVTITVEGPPQGAAIDLAIDGAPVPAATIGAPRKVNPGQHVITVNSPGFQTATQTVNLKEGEQSKAALKLVPGAPASSGPAPTRIHIESPDKPGNVIVDGKAVGATPLDVPVTAGAHHVEIEYPGGSRDDRSVDVGAGATVNLAFRPSLMDELARHRRGVHFGVAVGVANGIFIEQNGGPPLYGGSVMGVMNIGITPLFDFRTGVNATVLERGNQDAGLTAITATVPLLLGINYSPYFSSHVGLAGGFHMTIAAKPNGAPANFDAVKPGGTIGPEWSVLSVCAGDKRQYELGFWQGFRFGNLQNEYHQSVAFTYLML